MITRKIYPHSPAMRKAAGFAAFAVLGTGIISGCKRSEAVPDAVLQAQTTKSKYDGYPALGAVPMARPASPAAAPRQAPAGQEAAPAAALEVSTGAGCPDSMARVEAFCIDRFEITLVGGGGEVHPYFKRPPYGMAGLKAVSTPGVFPQGYMSQKMSAMACEAAGKRLCTLAEWQRACMGPAGTTFPYGNAAEAGRCNTNKRGPHILDKHFPDIPHMRRTGKHFNDPALLQDPDYLVRTGSMAKCASPEGVYDIDGNLSEWVSDTLMKGDGLHGTFAGDAFSGHGTEGCGRRTAAHAADYHDYSMGARCCADPAGRAGQ